MIWIKRIAPLVVIFLAWLGYTLYTDYSQQRRASYERSLALVTAQVWIASAKFRDDPQRFVAFRDSLLAAHDFTPAELREFTTAYEDNPGEYEHVTGMVSMFVDSLYLIEDSLLRADEDTADADSGADAGTVHQDPNDLSK